LAHESHWKIIRGHQRLSNSYVSKTQATTAAIEFAEKDGASGCRPEVVVCHEDGRFMTEWMFDQDVRADEAARPNVTPTRS
jgi:hypothetical protein